MCRTAARWSTEAAPIAWGRAGRQPSGPFSVPGDYFFGLLERCGFAGVVLAKVDVEGDMDTGKEVTMAKIEKTAENIKEDVKAAAREAGEDLRSGARKVAEDARETADRLADNASVDRLKERGAELADSVRETGREYAERAREAGEEYAERARAEAERLYEAGQRKAHEVAGYAEERYDEVSEMVRRHPAQALGIAAGVGFLVGLILARR